MSAPADTVAKTSKRLDALSFQVGREPDLSSAGVNARILLAEDNSTNRDVAMGMLSELGLRADAMLFTSSCPDTVPMWKLASNGFSGICAASNGNPVSSMAPVGADLGHQKHLIAAPFDSLA